MKGIYLLLFFLVVALGGYWYFAKFQSPATTPAPTVKVEKKVGILPSVPPVTVDTAELKAVGKYKGSGTATESFDGKTFKHSLTTYLPDPAPGKFYEGWLVKKKPSLAFFSTGKLTKNGAVYSLNYTAPRDEREYEFIVVTEETTALGLDGKPEVHVLEGTFWPESFAGPD